VRDRSNPERPHRSTEALKRMPTACNSRRTDQATRRYSRLPRQRQLPSGPILRIDALVESGLCRYIGERSVSIVVVKRVAVDACHKYIRMAVVVVIANRHADIVAASSQAGRLCHVSENTVAVVAEQAVAVLGWSLLSVARSARL